MTDTAAVALVAVLLGGPAVMLTPFWLAHLTSEQHADDTAEVIRAAGRDDATDATYRAVRKELTPR